MVKQNKTNNSLNNSFMGSFKGQFMQKIEILSLITNPHVVPNRKTFAHLHNTN